MSEKMCTFARFSRRAPNKANRKVMANIEKLEPRQEIERVRSKSQVPYAVEPLVQQLRELIENTRKRVASVVSDETTQMYWNVGNAINTFVLQGNRTEYGK